MKVVLHLLTGKSELERITVTYPANRLGIVKGVRGSLRRSKQLKDVKRQVVDTCEDFSIAKTVSVVRAVKKFENPGLVFAFASLRRTNIGISHLSQLARTDFSKEYEAALIELWDCLKPGQRREGSELRHSKSWSEIGFQGLDPATDFRGGGVLSLENLRYFAKESPEIARKILAEQCHDITKGGFPFALAGINITAFLLGLAQKRKLDDLFILLSSEAEEESHGTIRASLRRQSRAGPSSGRIVPDETSPLLGEDHTGLDEDAHQDDDQTRALALERFNGAYTVVFTMLANRWRQAAPRDVMGFPNVFHPFKHEIEILIETKEGLSTLAGV